MSDRVREERIGRANSAVIKTFELNGYKLQPSLKIDGVIYLEFLNIKTAMKINVKIRSSRKRALSISKKYYKLPNLYMAYVWLGEDNTESDPEIYLMQHVDAVNFAEKQGWTKTKSWESGSYHATKLGAPLIESLNRYKVENKNFRQLIRI